jgi:antitoxin CptB
MAPSTDGARLRWRCRRGMRELDVLLERFVAAGGAALAGTRLAAFERLLELPDPELAQCLILGQPAPPGLEDIVERIRAGADRRAR